MTEGGNKRKRERRDRERKEEKEKNKKKRNFITSTALIETHHQVLSDRMKPKQNKMEGCFRGKTNKKDFPFNNLSNIFFLLLSPIITLCCHRSGKCSCLNSVSMTLYDLPLE